MTSLSPCFSSLKLSNEPVFRETVTKNNIPTLLLVKAAMQKRNIAYDNLKSLEENCFKLLTELKSAVEEQNLHKITNIVNPSVVPIRPSMIQPDFLIPVNIPSAEEMLEKILYESEKSHPKENNDRNEEEEIYYGTRKRRPRLELEEE